VNRCNRLRESALFARSMGAPKRSRAQAPLALPPASAQRDVLSVFSFCSFVAPSTHWVPRVPRVRSDMPSPAEAMNRACTRVHARGRLRTCYVALYIHSRAVRARGLLSIYANPRTPARARGWRRAAGCAAAAAAHSDTGRRDTAVFSRFCST
jgi:hypothetical protein